MSSLFGFIASIYFSLVPVAYADSGVPPVLVAIAQCESGGRQFYDDGSVVVHKNANGTADYGLYQVNSTHLLMAKKMGLDVIHSAKDNAMFAYWLYAQDGTTPWKASSSCWGPS